jgi:hypothetical protein
MPIEATAPIEQPGRQPPRRRLSAGSVREIEAVLRSWGLGDRHASISCSWVVAEASSYLADERLRLVEQASAVDDRRWAAYVRAVAAIFAQATGKDPKRLDGGGELRSFEAFLLACLRLILPLATAEEIQAIRRQSLRHCGRPLDA